MSTEWFDRSYFAPQRRHFVAHHDNLFHFRFSDFRLQILFYLGIIRIIESFPPLSVSIYNALSGPN